MLSSIIAVAVLGAGTYESEGRAELRVSQGGQPASCWALDPQASFTVDGPATVDLVVRIDLADKPPKPKPVTLTYSLDGKKKTQKLKPVRAPKAAYDPPRAERPSQPAKGIAVTVPKGRHRLLVHLPPKVSGCVSLEGVQLGAPTAPAPVAAASESARPPPPAPAPPPQSASTAQPAIAAAEPGLEPIATRSHAAAGNGRVSGAPAEIALVAPPHDEVASMHEIRAASVGDANAPPPDAPASWAGKRAPWLRVGPAVGGVMPRGDLRAGLDVGLLVDVPFSTLGLPAVPPFDLSAYLEGGYSPMRQQDDIIIPGRGHAKLIQNSMVLPFELGLRARLPMGALTPCAALGFAMDVTRTELRAFSVAPVQENDVAMGVSVAAGIQADAGPGVFIAELRYREVHADLGAWSGIAEPTMAAAALHLGYLVALGP